MSRKCISLFVTGTDTGVGKTHVTAALLAALRSSGRDAVVMKPVQTGSTTAADLTFAARRAGWTPEVTECDDLAPYTFSAPASPHLAARLEGRRVDMRKLLAAHRRLCGRHEIVLVEGAGGLMVPLSERTTQIDFIQRMGMPVMLVARPGLGTLNHTLLSVEALRSRSIPVAAVVLSLFPRNPDRIAKDNARYLRAHLAPVPVLELSRLAGRASFTHGGHSLLRALEWR